MITGATKNKVDAIWTKMWEGGISNSLEIITQLTYLMFIRSLDDRENELEEMEQITGKPGKHIFPEEYDGTPGSYLRWSQFKHFEAETMQAIIRDKVFEFIKTELASDSAFAAAMADATFGINNARTLESVVTGIDELFNENLAGSDIGDLYEYMLSKLNAQKQNGQFRTPQHIRDMMVELIDPKPGQLICDPAMGTAGFLISSAEHIRDKYAPNMTEAEWQCFSGDYGQDSEGRQKPGSPQFSGFETDTTMLRIAAMNLMLHSITRPGTRYLNSLSERNSAKGEFDIILANPPFKGSLDREDIEGSLTTICDATQTELLFVALFIRMLKLGGRCACIVPNGVLFRTNSRAYRQLRETLVEKQKLDAVIHMPSGVFKPYSGVSTAVLIFTKTDAGGTDDVWMYNMEGDGFTLDDKRDPDSAHDDIPDILERFANLESENERTRKDKSFLVSKQEIVDNDYDLSFNKYSATIYEQVEYPPTDEILDDLKELSAQFERELAELERMLLGESEE